MGSVNGRQEGVAESSEGIHLTEGEGIDVVFPLVSVGCSGLQLLHGVAELDGCLVFAVEAFSMADYAAVWLHW